MARMEVNNQVARTNPRWLADYIDPQRNQAHYPAKLDLFQFNDIDAFRVTLTAQANAAATAMTITAITLPFGYSKIPKGTQLYFGGAKIAILDADYTGGTSMTVTALATQINSGDYATINPWGTRRRIASGTLIGRTYAEEAAGTPFGPMAVGDDIVSPLLYELDGNLQQQQYVNCELLRQGTGVTIKKNYLPEYTSLNTAANEVHTVTIAGTLSAGQFNLYASETAKTAPIAYNANQAAIQTAYDTVYGAGNTVIAGTIASYTVTYQGTYAGVDMDKERITPDGVTGWTSTTIQETTKGGKALLAKLQSAGFILITGTD